MGLIHEMNTLVKLFDTRHVELEKKVEEIQTREGSSIAVQQSTVTRGKEKKLVITDEIRVSCSTVNIC